MPSIVVEQLPPKGSERIFVRTESPWPANSLRCVASALTTPASAVIALLSLAPSRRRNTAGSIARGSAPGLSAMTMVDTMCCAGAISPVAEGSPGMYWLTFRVSTDAALSCLEWPYSDKPVTLWPSAPA